jgi:Ras GTPase-activating-like protein IQGAP2/3
MIDQKLPPIEELEEELRNGIYLAYLAKAFQPQVVKKIFEVSIHKINVSKINHIYQNRTRLQFKHSDNINFLFAAMRNVGLPEVFAFELTDLYDKKNIPKVIYCIHALRYGLFVWD